MMEKAGGRCDRVQGSSRSVEDEEEKEEEEEEEEE
jgi:hypothetical protein